MTDFWSHLSAFSDKHPSCLALVIHFTHFSFLSSDLLILTSLKLLSSHWVSPPLTAGWKLPPGRHPSSGWLTSFVFVLSCTTVLYCLLSKVWKFLFEKEQLSDTFGSFSEISFLLCLPLCLMLIPYQIFFFFRIF